MKLSEKQKEAIKYMRNGYELGHRTGYGSSVWLQEGGCGRGGNTAKIIFSTFGALEDRKLIAPKIGQSPFAQTTRYELTELGKTIQL